MNTSLLLALFASVCFGLNAIVVSEGLDRAADAGDSVPAFGATFVSIVVSVVVFWGVAVARGTTFSALSLPSLFPFVLAGILYPALFRLLYFTGIGRIGPNVAGGIVAANPIVAGVLAVPLLNEQLTLLTGVGVACIVGGGALLQLVGQDGTDASTDVLERELSGLTVGDALYPVGAAVAIGCGYVLIDLGLLSLPRPVVAITTTQTTALVLFAGLTAASADYRSQVSVSLRNRAATGLFAIAGLFVSLAWFGQFIALQQGSVVVVATLVNTFPLVIVVVSYATARSLPRNPYVVAGLLLVVAGANVIRIA